MLTKRQQRVLTFIETYQVREGGVSPSCAEIADGLGLSSKGKASVALADLEAAGFIRRLHLKARAIEVLRTGGKAPPFPGAVPIYDAATHNIRGWIA